MGRGVDRGLSDYFKMDYFKYVLLATAMKMGTTGLFPLKLKEKFRDSSKYT